MEENKIYCTELSKILFDNDKGQDYLKNVKLKDVRNNEVKEKYNKNKNEIEKIVQEWEMIKNNFEAMSKIMGEVDISIHLDNVKDKKFIIVTHQSFIDIKKALNKSLKLVEENFPGKIRLVYNYFS